MVPKAGDNNNMRYRLTWRLPTTDQQEPDRQAHDNPTDPKRALHRPRPQVYSAEGAYNLAIRNFDAFDPG